MTKLVYILPARSKKNIEIKNESIFSLGWGRGYRIASRLGD
jgi:hypothetical protein